MALAIPYWCQSLRTHMEQVFVSPQEGVASCCDIDMTFTQPALERPKLLKPPSSSTPIYLIAVSENFGILGWLVTEHHAGFVNSYTNFLCFLLTLSPISSPHDLIANHRVCTLAPFSQTV